MSLIKVSGSIRPLHHTLEAHRTALLQGQLLMIKGTLERSESVVHVIAGDIENLSYLLSELQQLQIKSRDFH